MKYVVDIPEWKNRVFWKEIETFYSKEEAIEFCKKHFQADNEGRISLITECETDELEDGEDE